MEKKLESLTVRRTDIIIERQKVGKQTEEQTKRKTERKTDR